MKLLTTLLLSILFLTGSNSFALDYSAQGGSRLSFDKIKTDIADAEALVVEIENEISAIVACGDLGQIYDGENCFTPVEDDPLIQPHGKDDIVLACAENESQYFNGATWACRAY